MSYSEAQLRDKIIKKLHLLDNGLTFIEKESYIPNDLGTRGFIDILAKDNSGHIVIIELKKSDPTTREALHEVLKYVEGIKTLKGLRNDEIRIIIVSTHWKELIVPYSSFHSQCKYNIEGYFLEVDSHSELVWAKKIEPFVLGNGRLFSDRHILRAYTSEERLMKGIERHMECYSKKNIPDYVLVVLKAPEGWREREITLMEHNLRCNLNLENGTEENKIIKLTLEKLPDYKFIIYSASLVMTEEKYWSILKTDRKTYKEISEFIDDYEGEDRIDKLHEYAVDCARPIPFCDTVDIGYAAKFQAYTEKNGWEIVNIIRGGCLQDENIIADETIINELKGCTGTTRQKYQKEFNSKNKADFAQIKREIEICLTDNLQWQRPIIHIFDYLEKTSSKRDFSGKIMIYNPMHTIYSIYLITSSGEINWLPHFYISVDLEGDKLLYFGSLERNGTKPNLEKVLKEHYQNSPIDLYYSRTWGGYQHEDTKIASSIGLKYSVHLLRIKDEVQQYYKYVDYDFQKCYPYDLFSEFIEYLHEETVFVHDIIHLFEDHAEEMGFVFF